MSTFDDFMIGQAVSKDEQIRKLTAQVTAMQTVCNAASILEHSWNNENEDDTDTTDQEMALWDAIKAYRASLCERVSE